MNTAKPLMNTAKPLMNRVTQTYEMFKWLLGPGEDEEEDGDDEDDEDATVSLPNAPSTRVVALLHDEREFVFYPRNVDTPEFVSRLRNCPDVKDVKTTHHDVEWFGLPPKLVADNNPCVSLK